MAGLVKQTFAELKAEVAAEDEARVVKFISLRQMTAKHEADLVREFGGRFTIEEIRNLISLFWDIREEIRVQRENHPRRRAKSTFQEADAPHVAASLRVNQQQREDLSRRKPYARVRRRCRTGG